MKLVREYIFEKFKQDSDPIKDLGIGLYKFWQQKYKEIGNTQVSNTFEKYFEKPYSFNAYDSMCVHKLWEILYYLITKENPQHVFDRAMSYLYNTMNKNQVNKMKTELAKILKKYFYIDVKPQIYEKFIEDSDPIKDLDIGNIFNFAKRGDVIESKKPFSISISGRMFTISNDNNITNTIAAIILDVHKKQNLLQITYVPFTNDINHESLKRLIINLDEINSYFTQTVITTLKNWDEFFKLTPREDFLNESMINLKNNKCNIIFK